MIRHPLTLLSIACLLTLGSLSSTVQAQEEKPLEGGVEDPAKIISSLQEGDMVFVQSHTKQAHIIRALTGSHMTHCGILFKAKDDKGAEQWVVYEGAGINDDKYKPLAEWKAHELQKKDGLPGDPKIYVRRLKPPHAPDGAAAPAKPAGPRLDKDQVKDLRKKAAALHHTPYDKKFSWDNEVIYCSELLYKAYDQSLGIQLVKLKTYGDLLKDPDMVARVDSLKDDDDAKDISAYLKSPKLKKNDPVVSPGDIIGSDALEVVKPVP